MLPVPGPGPIPHDDCIGTTIQHYTSCHDDNNTTLHKLSLQQQLHCSSCHDLVQYYMLSVLIHDTISVQVITGDNRAVQLCNTPQDSLFNPIIKYIIASYTNDNNTIRV